MGEYKRVADILKAIEDREQIHGLVEPKYSPDVKYKKAPKNKIVRPTLRVGSELVWSIGAGCYPTNGIKGYALGVVLDWGGNGMPGYEHTWGGGSWWGSMGCIVQVTRVSNPELEWMVGHLRQVTIHGYSKGGEMPLFTPEECNKADYGL